MPERIIRHVGWKKDHDDPNDLPLIKLAATRGVVIPDETDMEEHCPTPYDQKNTSSCVGQSSSGAIYTNWGVQGIKNRRVPSALWMYSIGRAVTNDETKDEGTFIRNTFKAAMILGIAPSNAMPFDPHKVNERPTWAAMRSAYDQRCVKGYYRITSSGGQRIMDIKRALATGHPVVYGLNITEEWFDYNNGVIENTGNSVGGHAMFIMGHYRDEWFKGQNSWGVDWGEHGRYKIRQSVVGGLQASDFWVIESAPKDSGT